VIGAVTTHRRQSADIAIQPLQCLSTTSIESALVSNDEDAATKFAMRFCASSFAYLGFKRVDVAAGQPAITSSFTV